MDHLLHRGVLPLRLAALAVAVWLIHPYIHPRGNHQGPSCVDCGKGAHTGSHASVGGHHHSHHEDEGENPECDQSCDLCAAWSEKIPFVLGPQSLIDRLARPAITAFHHSEPPFTGRLDWPESHSHRGPPVLIG